MKIQAFEWDGNNIEHIAQHAVDPDEVEAACMRKPFVLRGKGGLYLIYGRSRAGRYLLIVARSQGRGILRIITARDMTPAEKRLSRKRGK